jgi:hypothetical protein
VVASRAPARQGRDVRLEITPCTDIPRRARAAIRAEAERTARLYSPEATRVMVGGVRS